MAVKDKQQPFVEVARQRGDIAIGIEKGELVDGDFFHGRVTKRVCKRLSVSTLRTYRKRFTFRVRLRISAIKRGAPTQRPFPM